MGITNTFLSYPLKFPLNPTNMAPFSVNITRTELSSVMVDLVLG